MKEDILQVVANSPLAEGMQKMELEQLCFGKNSMMIRIGQGQRLFQEKDEPRKIFLLIKGKIIIARDTPSGKRMIQTKIEKAGELFGEVYAFMELPEYDLYAEALVPSVILSIDREVFLSSDEGTILQRKLHQNLLLIFAKKAYVMNQKLKVLCGGSIRGKLTRFLIERQDKDGKIVLQMTRDEMADYLNITRPSLSRELGNMVKLGILSVKRREIKIENQKALEEYVS